MIAGVRWRTIEVTISEYTTIAGHRDVPAQEVLLPRLAATTE
jgi:hypothetical protein